MSITAEERLELLRCFEMLQQIENQLDVEWDDELLDSKDEYYTKANGIIKKLNNDPKYNDLIINNTPYWGHMVWWDFYTEEVLKLWLYDIEDKVDFDAGSFIPAFDDIMKNLENSEEILKKVLVDHGTDNLTWYPRRYIIEKDGRLK